jgi:hypothetical protein
LATWRVAREDDAPFSFAASDADAFAPAALRASLASRGKPCGLSPPRDAWRPSKTAEPAAPDRPETNRSFNSRANSLYALCIKFVLGVVFIEH